MIPALLTIDIAAATAAATVETVSLVAGVEMPGVEFGVPGPPGPAGPPGGSGGSQTFTWRASTVQRDPGSGGIAGDSATDTAITALFVSVHDRAGQAMLALNSLQPGDDLYIYEVGEISTWDRYVLTGAVQPQGSPYTWAVLPVAFAESGPLPFTPGNNRAVELLAPTPVAIPTRDLDSVTTASLASGATENGTVNLALGYRLYVLTVDRACRVRLYIDAAHRAADAARPAGTDPTGDHGLVADFTFLAAGTLTCSPLIDGFVTAGVAVPYAIQNTSGAAAPVHLDLTWLRTE